MTTITSYRDLDAWQLGMTLVETIYALTQAFPVEEGFGLSAQVRRAAVGIPSNVAEGHQLGTRSYRHHVLIALGCQHNSNWPGACGWPGGGDPRRDRVGRKGR